MVAQVQVVSILMIVHGSLGILVGILYAAMGPTMIALNSFQPGPRANPQDETMMMILTIVCVLLGVVFLAVGILNIVAGARMLKFRGKTLGMVALISNVVYLLASCLCIPFSLGLLIYGLIVLVDRDVTAAFRMAGEGYSPREIRDHFRSYRRYEPEENEGPYPRDYPEDEGRRWRDRPPGGDEGIQREEERP